MENKEGKRSAFDLVYKMNLSVAIALLVFIFICHICLYLLVSHENTGISGNVVSESNNQMTIEEIKKEQVLESFVSKKNILLEIREPNKFMEESISDNDNKRMDFTFKDRKLRTYFEVLNYSLLKNNNIEEKFIGENFNIKVNNNTDSNSEFKWGYDFELKDLKFIAKLVFTSDKDIIKYGKNAIKLGRENIISFKDLEKQGYNVYIGKPDFFMEVTNSKTVPDNSLSLSENETNETTNESIIDSNDSLPVTGNAIYGFGKIIGRVIEGEPVNSQLPMYNNSITVYIERDFTGTSYKEGDIVHLDPELIIIPAYDAIHLDNNLQVISDIYPEISAKDDIWSETVNFGEYVRVYFSKNLTRKNDITLYAKSNDNEPMQIEVYREGSNIPIARFDNILNENWYKTILTGLNEDESQQVFDMKIIGNEGSAVMFDYIVDPTENPPNMTWNASYDSGGADTAHGIAVDSSGNVYVTGTLDNLYYKTIKYSSTGSEAWNITYTTGGNNIGYGIAVDNAANAYVTGSSDLNSLTFKYNSSGNQIFNITGPNGISYAVAADLNQNIYIAGASSSNYFTIKYNSTGGQMWNASYDSGALDSANGIAVDSPGNVYATGNANNDFYTIKYDAAGTQIWNATYNCASDIAYGIAVDSSGNVYVTGEACIPGVMHTIKYNSSGSEVWNVSEQALSSGRAIAVDNDSNVYVAGQMNGNDFLIIKYNSSGGKIWNLSYDSGGSDILYGIALDAQKNIYATGNSNNNYMTIKYLLNQSGSSNETLMNNSFNSECSDGWCMFGRTLDHHSAADENFSTICGLNRVNYSTGGSIGYVQNVPVIAKGFVYMEDTINKKIYQLNASNVSQTIANLTINYLQDLPDPIYSYGSIYTSYYDTGTLNSNALGQLNYSNISQVISNNLEIGMASPLIIANNYIYRYRLQALNTNINQYPISNLSQIFASSYHSNGGGFGGSYAYANGFFYFFGGNSSTNGFYKYNASNISQLVNYNGNLYLSQTTWISIWNGNVYAVISTNINTDDILVQVNADNLSIISNFTLYSGAKTMYSYSSPAVANGYVYIGSVENNKVYQLNASNVSQKFAEFIAGGQIWASPTYANGYIYIGDNNGLNSQMFQLNASNISQKIANFSAGNSVTLTAAYAKGYIYFGTQGGYFFQLNATNISLENNFGACGADTIPPVVNLINPVNDSYINYTSQYYTANITDAIQLINATLIIWNSTGQNVNNVPINISGIFNTTNITYSVPYTGRYYWNYYACDNSTNCRFANSNFTIWYLNQSPNITNIQYANESRILSGIIEREGNISINATVTDSSGISRVWIKVWDGIFGISNVIYQGFLSFLNGNIWNIVFSVNSTYPLGLVNYTIYANNTGNLVSNITSNFSLSDNYAVSYCRNLDTANSVYNLLNNIYSNANFCFNITADNVTIDCHGFSISNITANSIGIFSKQFYTKIINCRIDMNDSAGSIGIYLLSSNNSRIYNTSINYPGLGIYLENTKDTSIEKVNEYGSIDGVKIRAGYNISINDSSIVNSDNNSVILEVNNGNAPDKIYFNNDIFSNTNPLANSLYTTYIGTGSVINGINLNNATLQKYSINLNAALNFDIKNQYGEIVFLTPINGTGSDFSSEIKMTDNYIFVNSSNAILNKSANITLFNIGERGFKQAIFIRDNIFPCNSTTVPTCFNFTAMNNTFVMFNASSWSNYSVGSMLDFIYPIFSNYSDNTGILTSSGTGFFNSSISNTNGTVLLQFNGVNYTATNLVSNIYNVSIAIGSAGTYSYKWFSFGTGILNNINVSSSLSYVVNSAGTGSTGGGGGGGGGGGKPKNPIEPVITCTSSFQCTGWSACSYGEQTRTCSDTNNCGSDNGKPIESQECTNVINNETEIPATVDEGIVVERPKPKIDTGTTPEIIRALMGKNENTENTEQWVCGDYGECIAKYDIYSVIMGKTQFIGEKQRECKSLKTKETIIEKDKCTAKAKMSARKVFKCGTYYIEIYDEKNNLISTLELLPDNTLKEKMKLNIRISIDDSNYCDYCFDDVKDYDEDSVDCVNKDNGNCPKCDSSYFR